MKTTSRTSCPHWYLLQCFHRFLKILNLLINRSNDFPPENSILNYLLYKVGEIWQPDSTVHTTVDLFLTSWRNRIISCKNNVQVTQVTYENINILQWLYFMLHDEMVYDIYWRPEYQKCDFRRIRLSENVSICSLNRGACMSRLARQSPQF